MENDQMEQTNDVLEVLKKLPPVAYIDSKHNSAGAPVIAVKRGERGFYPIFTTLTADELNTRAGVTKAQAEAMHIGSMMGWEVPGANPDNYLPPVVTEERNSAPS